MKLFSPIFIFIIFLPTFAVAEESTKSIIGKLKEHELVAVCAVSIYVKNDNLITNDVQHFLNKFRRHKPLSNFYSDKVLLNKGKQWMIDRKHINKVGEITQICKKLYMS